jgi:hypothetical protein
MAQIELNEEQCKVIRRALKARKRQVNADFNRLRNDKDLWYVAKYAIQEFDICQDLLDKVFPNEPPKAPAKG